MAVTGTIAISTSFTQDVTGAPTGPGATTISNQQSLKCTFGSPGGTGADLINLKHSRSYALAGAPLVLDLRSLADIAGAAIVFGKVRSVTIANRATNDTYVLTVGYATTTSNAWTGWFTNPGQLTVYPSTASNSGVLVFTAPNASGAAVSTSSKLLVLDPGANSFTVDVEITGTT